MKSWWFKTVIDETHVGVFDESFSELRFDPCSIRVLSVAKNVFCFSVRSFVQGLDSTIGLLAAASYDAVPDRHLSGVTSCEIFCWPRH